MSVVLPEERDYMLASTLREVTVKWARRGVDLEIRNVTMYRCRDLILLALAVKSDDVVRIRRDLGLRGVP